MGKEGGPSGDEGSRDGSFLGATSLSHASPKQEYANFKKLSHPPLAIAFFPAYFFRFYIVSL